MKMEVVLSAPGCFGNDGSPFKNEEIREWSRVDRLTGMLERARIETGRWRTSDDASAHSYGKVTDLRERNSADGCIRQKAKRQVEIFQSQEPGKSVQVFRASQWSSSRVTDGIVKSIMSNQLDPIANVGDEVLDIDPWKFPSLTLASEDGISLELNDNSTLSNKNSSLKHTNSFERYLCPKRYNSNEDLTSLVDSDGSSRLSSMSFARDSKNRRSLQIPTSISVPMSNHDELKKAIVNKGARSSTSPATSGTYASSIRIADQRKSDDYGSLCRRSPIVATSPRQSRSSSTTRPNAITVVNLMQSESIPDNSGNRKSSIVTLRPSLVHSDDPPKSRKLSVAKASLSGDENGVNLPGRAVKKVGFSKTEVHFVADSGKVNIVETDGKPPPTNKFRRRRRNQNQIATSGNPVGRSVACDAINSIGKTPPRRMIIKAGPPENEKIISGVDNDDSGAYCVVDLESRKYWANPNENQRIHMTTVEFGKSDRRPRDVEELKQPDDLASPKVVSEVLTRKSRDPDCSIITTDSENNRVLSTIITTHESTVARVEDNRIKAKKSKVESRLKSPTSKKKNESKVAAGLDVTDNVNKIQNSNNAERLQEMPVYVNVFKTPDDRYPVYENYRVNTTKDHSISTGIKPPHMESLSVTKTTTEKKRSKAKSPNKLGKRSPVSLSRLSSLSRSSGKSQHDSTKTKTLKRTTANEDTIKSTGRSSPMSVESKTKKSEYETGSTRSRRVPIEVVYRTAVFNMKNEKLSKPVKEKDLRATPRSINDLICGTKISRTNNSKRKGSASSQSSINGAPRTKHWK